MFGLLPTPIKLPLTKLPLRFQIDNALFVLAGAFNWTFTIQWTINTWRAQYRTWKRNGAQGMFWPRMPMRRHAFVYLTGESAAGMRQRMRVYGVPSQLVSLRWALWPKGEGIGVKISYLVPRPQAWMADVILRWGEGGTYKILSPPILDRMSGDSASYAARSTPWRPWGVPAKARSWDEAISNSAFGMIAGREKLQ